MTSELQIKNVSQMKGVDLSLISIQNKDIIKISIPPKDFATTKIQKEGVKSMSVSVFGRNSKFLGRYYTG